MHGLKNRLAVTNVCSWDDTQTTHHASTQIADNIKLYGRKMRLRHAVIMGGVSQRAQVRAMENGVDILIANKDEQAHLLHNVVADRGQWITFRLIDKHGKTAEGMTVEVRFEGKTLYRDARSAFSYLGCSDPRVHFGLGADAGVQAVGVVWPNGTRERWSDIAVDGFITLREGSGTAWDAKP